MKRLFSIRPVYCLFVMSLVILAGCQTSRSVDGTSGAPVAVKNSEELLSAEGQMELVEDKREASPIEQHMKARGDVDPAKINKKNKFTTNVKDSHAKDKTNFRVVRVEGDTSTIDQEMQPKGLKIEPDPMNKQAQAKSYVEAVLAKHKARQEGKSYGDQGANRMVKKDAPKVVADASVNSVRFGQHPGKTRIVLDVSDKTGFQTSFESGNKTLVVTLPNAAWEATPKTKSSGKNLISGYDTRATAAGSVLKVSLSAPGRLLYQKAMKPSGKYGHRIVLDVVPR